jgi:hypothetical protein
MVFPRIFPMALKSECTEYIRMRTLKSTKLFSSIFNVISLLQSKAARTLRADREGVRELVHGECLTYRETGDDDREDGEGVHLHSGR